MALSLRRSSSTSRFVEWPSDPEVSDTLQIVRTQAGDVQAFNQLIERYQQRVYAVCLRMVGDEDADDVTQEVFLSAYRGIRHYHGGSFNAWILRITSNKCLDHLRARNRRTAVSLFRNADDTDEVSPFQVSDRGDGPEQHVLRAELARSLELMLQALPANQRLVVILSDIQGYSYAEISATTGWPAGTVKSRLSRARARLRHALQQPNG